MNHPPHNATATLLHHLHHDTEMPLAPLPTDEHLRLDFLEASIAWQEIREQWQEEMVLLARAEQELADLRREVEILYGKRAA